MKVSAQLAISRTSPDGETCTFAGYKQAGKSVGKTGAEIKRACREKQKCYGYWWQDRDTEVPEPESYRPRCVVLSILSVIRSSLASVSAHSLAALLGPAAPVGCQLSSSCFASGSFTACS